MNEATLSPTGNPPDDQGLALLSELALDLRWSWGRATDHLWRRLDPELWEQARNPWMVLQTVPPARLAAAWAESGFRGEVERLVALRRRRLETPAWFQQHHAGSSFTSGAYFSMEFMLNEALPIYSGGLGNVAGDQLKAASDLGVPVVGVGLLYQQGYFRQLIDRDGSQQAFYPYNDPRHLPLTPVRSANGDWLRLEIMLSGNRAVLRPWQVQIGRVRLYLLDTNDPANLPAVRGTTSELYGGGPEMRLRQELVLGIGGWRLLAALGLRPEVCHLNEGHAAFAILERARSFMAETSLPFSTALVATRAGNLFTTHTAVAAGFDHFAPELIEQYLGAYARDSLGITTADLLALGRANPRDDAESFNPAFLALRGSSRINGVSRLHGQVSQQIFQPLFPRWPEREVPVAHVTNGVHVPSWESPVADETWTQAGNRHRWREDTAELEVRFRGIPARQLWEMRTTQRTRLIEFVRARLAWQLRTSGSPPAAVDRAAHLFDPNVLTLGFARRFTGYKRPNLLLHDSDRLLRLLGNPQRPVQLVIAGKAHPADLAGQAMIREWVHFIRERCREHAVFLGDYDLLVAERLVQGVDIWLNTPRRPWEACGTSGMKVLVNGGLNLSTLDGWWAEACAPEVGWAIGGTNPQADEAAQDAADAESLYRILEERVVPAFYARDEAGLPAAWLDKVRESMARLTARFSTHRAVRQYVEEHYLPAAAAFRERAAERGRLAMTLDEALHRLAESWSGLRFGRVTVVTANNRHEFEVQAYLGGLDPALVRVQLYADGRDGGNPERQDLTRDRPLVGAVRGYCYRGAVTVDRPAGDYTVRMIPCLPQAAVPLEAGQILWQR